jgi:UDP-N-acetyl-D-mannosaminuronic acid dehydrogenase
VGGHCISVDPWFFVEAAPDLTPLIKTARTVNDDQPEFVVSMIERILGSLSGKKIAVLGLSFKPDVDDLRESPAVEAAHLLAKASAIVTAYEPFKADAVYSGFICVDSLEKALAGAEAVILLVGHAAFKALNPQEMRKMTSAKELFDMVNGWDKDAFTQAGFNLHRLGVGKPQ